jgi:hypothetical protein
MEEIKHINAQLYFSNYDGGYMFRLRKVAIVRQCISEVQTGK